MNIWSDGYHYIGRYTIIQEPIVEVECRGCDTKILVTSAAVALCPNPDCAREYRLSSVKVFGRFTSKPCPELSEKGECTVGGQWDSRCDFWQNCGWRKKNMEAVK